MRRLAGALRVMTLYAMALSALALVAAGCGSGTGAGQAPPTGPTSTSAATAPSSTTAAGAAAAPSPSTTAPLVTFSETPPQPPPGTLVTPPRDATADFAAVGAAASVDELLDRILAPIRSSPEPTPAIVSVQEITKGLEYRISLRTYGFQDDATAGRDYDIVAGRVAGGFAVTGATSVSECRRGVAGPGVCV